MYVLLTFSRSRKDAMHMAERVLVPYVENAGETIVSLIVNSYSQGQDAMVMHQRYWKVVGYVDNSENMYLPQNFNTLKHGTFVPFNIRGSKIQAILAE